MTDLFIISASAKAAAPAAPIKLPAAAPRAPESNTKVTPPTDQPRRVSACASHARRTSQINRRYFLIHLQRLRDSRRASVAQQVGCRRAPRAARARHGAAEPRAACPLAARHAPHKSISLTFLFTFSASAIADAPASPVAFSAAARP